MAIYILNIILPLFLLYILLKRLTLPGKLNNSGDESARFDADTQSYVIHIIKSVPGEIFEELDMLNKLLMPSPLLSVNTLKIEDLSTDKQSDDEVIDWRIEQTPYIQDDTDSFHKPKYGFGNKYSVILGRLQAEIPDIVDLPSADSTPQIERKIYRIYEEHNKFDEEHYLADYIDDESIIDNILVYSQWWDEDNFKVVFSDKENAILTSLKPRRHLLTKRETHCVYLSLVDILFAYAYESRITLGDLNVESGWTIKKICSTFSWLEIHETLHSVLVACYRRSFCYPLIRNWSIAEEAQRDVVNILNSGRHCILRCLMEIYEMMKYDEKHYILNELYINDYIIWCQFVNKKKFKKIADKIESITLTNDDIDLNIDVLESILEYTNQEEESTDSSDDIVDKFDSMNLKKKQPRVKRTKSLSKSSRDSEESDRKSCGDDDDDDDDDCSNIDADDEDDEKEDEDENDINSTNNSISKEIIQEISNSLNCNEKDDRSNISAKDKLITEVNKEEKLIIEVSKEEKLITEVNKEEKLITEVNKEEKLITEVSKEEKLITEVSKEEKLITEVSKEEKLIIEVSKEEKLITEVCNEEKLITEEKLIIEVSKEKKEIKEDKKITKEIENIIRDTKSLNF